MSPFDDDNLEQLKKVVPDEFGEWAISKEELDALLARLQAAEQFGEMMCLTYDDAEDTILYKSWRKAAGK